MADHARRSIIFNTEREQEIARAAFAHIKHFERLSRSIDLKSPENLKKLIAQAQEAAAPTQPALEGVGETVNVGEIVAKTVDLFIEKSIDIPKIVVVPKGEVKAGFAAFDLDLKGVHLQPVAQDILIAHL